MPPGADPSPPENGGKDIGEVTGSQQAFWADRIADEVETRDPEDPIVVKGGISPSGVPHLGNVNEIMRGYFIAEVLRDRGHDVRQVFTTDDRDPLRRLPRQLADLEGTLVGLDEVDAGALGRNLGKPYTDVPDPFGCCGSYGEHFSKLVERSADLLGVPIEVVSNTALYEDGTFDGVTRRLLERREEAREVLAGYQAKVNDAYVPFNPICANCGKITETVAAVDPEAGTVDYRCTEIEAGGQTIEGCGHEATATLREGKLPWRFEWPAQWEVLGVDVEPFGKDHAEGSWPSGEHIARTLFGIEPPVPMVYEWFTLDGEPFSSSAGNVVLVSTVLELVEPAVLRYFFSKDPAKARDFSLERLDLLVDEFDRFERLYYEEESGTPHDEALASRVYPFLLTVEDIPLEHLDLDPSSFDYNDPEHRELRREFVDGTHRQRVRFPYTFAAVLGMFPDESIRREHARKQAHLPENAPEWAVEAAFERVGRARKWAEQTDNEYNYTVLETVPSVELDAAVESALSELAAVVEAGGDGDEIQGAIYETAKRHDIPVGDFFAAGYRLFFGQAEGPRLGPFLAELDRSFVSSRLRREG